MLIRLAWIRVHRKRVRSWKRFRGTAERVGPYLYAHRATQHTVMLGIPAKGGRARGFPKALSKERRVFFDRLSTLKYANIEMEQ